MSLRRRFRPGRPLPHGETPPEAAEEQPLPPVALRQLVVATSSDDVSLPGWQSILDRIGSPYDVLFADREVVTRSRLVRGDVGRYNGVLLTNGGLLHRDRNGRFVSAFDTVAWNLLWEYERTFGIRQVALGAAPGAGPEEVGLRLVGEGPIGEEAAQLSLTRAGAAVFDHLRRDARLPLSDTYLYRTRVPPGAHVTPLLEVDGDVVVALAPARDGRERLVVGFSIGAHQAIEDLLGYGLVRWVTRGVLLGEHRHWLNVDVDDWCDLDGSGDPAAAAPGRPRLPSVVGASTLALARAQQRLRREFPLASGLTLNLAYNAGGAPAWSRTVAAASALPGPGTIPAASFRWVNHTFSHPSLDTTSYEQSYAEIDRNIAAARERNLPVDPAVLKTPAYSGLGVLITGEMAQEVVDRGLEASNPRLLEAARDLGVRYVHGNMSFPSHHPECFNGGIVHPLEPGIVVVPDWPTAIPWWAGTPEELVEGSATAAPTGIGRRTWGHDAYDEIVEHEAEVAYGHLVSGSVYTHTLHRANTYEYAPGRSLAVDWLRRLLEKYTETFTVPLLTPDWTTLAGYVAGRMRHRRLVASGHDAVWDRAAGTVRFRSPSEGSLFLTGALPAEAGADAGGPGRDHVQRLDLGAGETAVLRAAPTP